MKIPQWNQSGGGYGDSEMKAKPISKSQSLIRGWLLLVCQAWH